VVATGGQAKLISKGSKHIQHTDEFFDAHRAAIDWEKNQGASTGKVRVRDEKRRSKTRGASRLKCE